MLDEFIRSNRQEVIARTRTRVAQRAAPRATEHELSDGVPRFLDQLVEQLRADAPSESPIGESGSIHGEAMLRQGYSVAQVVQDYGDVCQAVTELAIELKAPITTEEFKKLNRCLDLVTAGAVTEFERQRDRRVSLEGTERLGFLAHELRNALGIAVMAFDALREGRVAIGGSTGALLSRSLSNLGELIDRALAEVRLDSGVERRERLPLGELVEEVEIVAAHEAKRKGIALTVACGDRTAEIDVDRHILAAALGNLLNNALKFTHRNGHVTLRARVTDDRVMIDVEDECGGLPSEVSDRLFQPFSQGCENRSGLGLGLVISRRGVEANGGELRVRDLPGKGCVFTIDLPRAAPTLLADGSKSD